MQRQLALQNWINSHTSYQCDELEIVSGDASFRRYFRFKHQSQSVIAVDAPPEKESSRQFIEVAGAYHAANISVPEIYAVDLEQGFYLQQDFGNRLFADDINLENMDELYTQALDILPSIQDVRMVYGESLPAFDQTLLDNESYLFRHWLCEVHLQLNMSKDTHAMLDDAFAQVESVFLTQPQGGVHRDYHSRNLMMLGDAIGVIDFQDAVIGPITYDAVSLLRDCYQHWPDEKVYDLLEKWRSQHYPEVDKQQMIYWFDFAGMQRHIKASGIFARLCHRDGKRSYLQDIPNTLEHLIKVSCRYPQLKTFTAFVENMVMPKMSMTI